MIDEKGFRLNVGIVLSNASGKLFWGKRAAKTNGWQFPQGGINVGEEIVEAMFRELHEELGLVKADVKIIAESTQWLCYYLPKHFRRYYSKPLVIGQKQKWFLLRLESDDSHIQLEAAETPEFCDYVWVDYWYPIKNIIPFKRHVYKSILQEFESNFLPANTSQSE